MKIALTFDVERDIPNFLDTDFGIKIGLIKILKLLEEHQIKATFFCAGNVAKQLRWVVPLIETKEHEIACHSLNHERLNKLSFEECKQSISNNKKLIENECRNSKIIGFRAPYLKPPRFIYRLLNDLGFKYDSSISSHKKSESYYLKDYNIQEFHPFNLYFLFRLPIGFSFIKKWVFKKELSILYFHSWEAIDIKRLILNQSNKFNLFKDYFFRIDRWVNTGDLFIKRLRNFIKEALSKKVEFVTLRDLMIYKERTLT